MGPGFYVVLFFVFCLSSLARDIVDYVNPLIGNGGTDPNNAGGMVPSTAPPFAMTRWVAQTRQNYVSMLPYNYTDTSIHGFQATHQPAIWMGESASVVVVPGAGRVRDLFEERGMKFRHDNEHVSASYYSVDLETEEGERIFVEQTATSRVGHLRFKFKSTRDPYILIQATRPSVIGSADPSNVTYPLGTVSIDPSTREITGRNPERQDFIIQPTSTPARGFNGYFCARFDTDFRSWGTANNGTLHDGEKDGNGAVLSAYVTFPPAPEVTINVRIGISYISVEQARRNLDLEIPDGTLLEVTASKTKELWAEKLNRIVIEGATDEEKEIFYTAFFHTLQYPNEQSEEGRYYSGYDDRIHEGESYTGYSIWDTYRAQWAWLILFVPERIPAMIQSMLQDYDQGGWLPMWKNVIETNIMVGTHADSLIAEAVVKGITGFDMEKAYKAMYKDATVAPVDDHKTSYFDRQENVDYEVRAGLSEYAVNGWVASDIHSEAASRTLDYAYDDYAVAVFAAALNKSDDAMFFEERAKRNAFTMFNEETGFMEARNANGSWAGPNEGWTEGDKWCYSFDVMHDVPTLIDQRGGRAAFIRRLDEHFDGGHNDHTNEPSHHIPYLYALAGAASKTQKQVRSIAKLHYNNTVNGLSGNEDCGQMSAWYLFSALGFYPVNPVSGEYVIGSPFFDQATIWLHGYYDPLVISSPGAPNNIFVKSLWLDGESHHDIVITHSQITKRRRMRFEMSHVPQSWSSSSMDGHVDSMSYQLKHEEL